MVIHPSHKHLLNLQFTVYCCQFIGIPMLAHSILTQVSGATFTLCDLLAGIHFRIPLFSLLKRRNPSVIVISADS
jgi:hypothetical protein